MATAWGNALESLGQSLPAMTQAIDKNRLQQQQYALDMAAQQRQQAIANAQIQGENLRNSQMQDEMARNQAVRDILEKANTTTPPDATATLPQTPESKPDALPQTSDNTSTPATAGMLAPMDQSKLNASQPIVPVPSGATIPKDISVPGLPSSPYQGMQDSIGASLPSASQNQPAQPATPAPLGTTGSLPPLSKRLQDLGINKYLDNPLAQQAYGNALSQDKITRDMQTLSDIKSNIDQAVKDPVYAALIKSANDLPTATGIMQDMLKGKNSLEVAQANGMSREAAAQIRADAAEQIGEIKANSQQTRLAATVGQKENQRTSDRLSKLSKDLDPSAMVRGAFSVSKQIIDRSDRLKTLDEAVNSYQNGNADSRQIEELAIGMNALLSGSNQGAQKQVESLVPKSVLGNASKLYEFLSNNPTGTNQQAFVQRMMGTIQRERETAENQIKKTRFQRIAQYKDVEQSDPVGFNDVLRSWEVNPDEYATWKKNGFKSPDVTKGNSGNGGTSKQEANDVTTIKSKSGHSYTF